MKAGGGNARTLLGERNAIWGGEVSTEGSCPLRNSGSGVSSSGSTAGWLAGCSLNPSAALSPRAALPLAKRHRPEQCPWRRP